MADRGRPRARSAPFLAKKPALASKFFFDFGMVPTPSGAVFPAAARHSATRRREGLVERFGGRSSALASRVSRDWTRGMQRRVEILSAHPAIGRGAEAPAAVAGPVAARIADRPTARSMRRRRPGIAVRCARRIAPGRGVSACGGLSGHATVRLIGGAGAGRWCTRSWAASGHATLRLTGGAGRFIMDPLLLAPDVSP